MTLAEFLASDEGKSIALQGKADGLTNDETAARALKVLTYWIVKSRVVRETAEMMGVI